LAGMGGDGGVWVGGGVCGWWVGGGGWGVGGGGWGVGGKGWCGVLQWGVLRGTCMWQDAAPQPCPAVLTGDLQQSWGV
jgi:hypothetical protein